MQVKRTIIIVSFCLLGFTGVCQPKNDDIKDLVIIMHLDSVIDKYAKPILTSLTNKMMEVAKDSITKAASKEIIDYSTESFKVMIKKFIEDDFTLIYKQYYTNSEIKDLVAFYKSSAGQKMVKNSVLINNDIKTSLMQVFLPAYKDDILKKIKEIQAKYKGKIP